MAKISTYTSKTTPVDADSLPMTDSADSNNTKRLTWANLKATLKTYFDTLYATAKPQAEWRADTHAGYGSTDTRIPYFTNIRSNVDTAGAMTVVNNSTNGCKITINIADYYTVLYSFSPSSNAYIGISLNSSQLTTGAEGINVQNRLALAYTFSTETSTITARVWCAVNDVLRPHGTVIGASTAAFSHFSITRG